MLVIFVSEETYDIPKRKKKREAKNAYKPLASCAFPLGLLFGAMERGNGYPLTMAIGRVCQVEMPRRSRTYPILYARKAVEHDCSVASSVF